MQSESVELWILLSCSDELTIYTLLPLHRAFHVARAWPNSNYEDINEIFYRPSIVPGGGAEQYLGGLQLPPPPPPPPSPLKPPRKTATGPKCPAWMLRVILQPAKLTSFPKSIVEES